MTLSPEQTAERLKGIGGSDAAAVLGLSKWKTARQLYHEKRGEYPVDPEDFENEAMWWGRMLEPIVRQRYADKTKRTVRLPVGTLRHPQHDFMLAHIDGFSLDPGVELASDAELLPSEHCRGYEGKTAYHSTGWGEQGTDQIPTEYLLQVHHYMAVTAFPLFDVCCLIGRRFAYYEVKFDSELAEMLIESEQEFWDRVRAGDPPALNFQHRTALDVVKKLHPGTNGVRLIASSDAIAWRAKLQEATAAEKAAKATADAMRARILDVMGDAAFLAFPDGKAFRRQLTTRKAYSVAETTFVDGRFINDPGANAYGPFQLAGYSNDEAVRAAQ